MTKIKIVPCVLRQRGEKTQVLAFVHPPPLEDFQLVKGTVDRGEQLENAALRELYEESGIGLSSVRSKIGTLEFIHPVGGKKERQFWKIFHVDTMEDLPERWNHIVTGNGEDRRMNFRFYWHDLDGPEDGFHPYFQAVLEKIRRYVKVLAIRHGASKHDLTA